MTGLTRQQAAEAVAALFGTSARRTRESRVYDPWEVPDQEGKKWRFVYDASILPTHPSGLERANSSTRHLYHVEMNSPVLEYSEMKKLQQVVRALRQAGAVVNSSCGMHVHVDAANHTPQSLKNALTIMYAKEDILFKALKVNENRVQRWCQKAREPMLEKIRKMPTNLTMEQLKQQWYGGTDESRMHYSWTRYYALNLHSVFYRGTLEWRCFESTLHAGKVRANIWQLLTQDPSTFRGGGIWDVMVNIHGALQAIGYGLLVLFFAVGVVRTCVIFSIMAASPPAVDADVSAVTTVWSYIGELVFNLLVLVGAVKMSDRIVKEIMGL